MYDPYIPQFWSNIFSLDMLPSALVNFTRWYILKRSQNRFVSVTKLCQRLSYMIFVFLLGIFKVKKLETVSSLNIWPVTLWCLLFSYNWQLKQILLSGTRCTMVNFSHQGEHFQIPFCSVHGNCSPMLSISWAILFGLNMIHRLWFIDYES